MTKLEKELTEVVKKQSHQIEVLTEQVAFLTKKLFGTSSEKSKVGEGQGSLFDEQSPFLTIQSQLRKKPTKK
jgi:transposase